MTWSWYEKSTKIKSCSDRKNYSEPINFHREYQHWLLTLANFGSSHQVFRVYYWESWIIDIVKFCRQKKSGTLNFDCLWATAIWIKLQRLRQQVISSPMRNTVFYEVSCPFHCRYKKQQETEKKMLEILFKI